MHHNLPEKEKESLSLTTTQVGVLIDLTQLKVSPTYLGSHYIDGFHSMKHPPSLKQLSADYFLLCLLTTASRTQSSTFNCLVSMSTRQYLNSILYIFNIPCSSISHTKLPTWSDQVISQGVDYYS